MAAIAAMTLDDQVAWLTKGCVDVVRRDDLRRKLERSASSGTPLVVKVGFDPTAPDLHLGHTVLIRKMKHFQDLGHSVIFVIGDFTGMIGDPTGRSKTRPPLSREEIDQNAETYKSQVFTLLDAEKTVVDFNSRWLGALDSEGWVRLAARYNVAQMLERRDFKQRYESGQPIGVHEFLYPLAQAYDSVFLKADVELGGTDQLFNLNVGRDIMPSFGLEAQIVMTMPLLEGLDGVEKMSKSLGNYVGITEPANEMFGKLMSISDELMWRFYELLTDTTQAEVAAKRVAVTKGELHPMRAKADLARSIVRDFHSAEVAAEAEAAFERVVVRRERPDPEKMIQARVVVQLPVKNLLDSPVTPHHADLTAQHNVSTSDNLSRILVACRLASSTSDATRKIQQGAVRIDGEKVTDFNWRVPRPGDYVIQVGPRGWLRISWPPESA